MTTIKHERDLRKRAWRYAARNQVKVSAYKADAERFQKFAAVKSRHVPWDEIGLCAAAASTFFLATGIGRFTYTAILPSMIDAGVLTHRSAGLLASTNLTGYLLGALCAMLPAARNKRYLFVCIASVAVVVASALMASDSDRVWTVARFLAGAAGGVIFVLGSSMVLERAALQKRKLLTPVAFSGVGLGITLSGLCTPAFLAYGGWRPAWVGFSILGAIAAIVVLACLKPGEPLQSVSRRERENGRHDGVLFVLLLLAYSAEGIGYIIPATFLVAMASHEPGLGALAQSVWILVGIVAIPSVLVWTALARRYGDFPVMTGAMILQAGGFFALSASSNPFGYVLGAIALGATFIGISALGVKIGRDIYSVRGNVTIAGMTVLFGIGQIVGPLLATAVTTAESGYGTAVVLAASIVAVGAAAAAAASLLKRSMKPLPSPSASAGKAAVEGGSVWWRPR